MAIPMATTTVDVMRGDNNADPDAYGYDGPAPALSTVETSVRAVISGPASVVIDGAEVDRWQLRTDPCDMRIHDHVLDLSTNITYRVTKCVHSKITTFGLDHVHAELSEVTGLPSEGGADVDS